MWNYLAIPIVLDLTHDIVEGRAHSNLVVGSFILSTFVLTSLQFFWGLKILRAALKMRRPGKQAPTFSNAVEAPAGAVASDARAAVRLRAFANASKKFVEQEAAKKHETPENPTAFERFYEAISFNWDRRWA